MCQSAIGSSVYSTTRRWGDSNVILSGVIVREEACCLDDIENMCIDRRGQAVVHAMLY